MKKFLSIALSFVLIVCIAVLTTGCTTKVKGKTFEFTSAEYVVSTEGMTNEEKLLMLGIISTFGVDDVDVNTSDADLTTKLNEALRNRPGFDFSGATLVFTEKEVAFWQANQNEPTGKYFYKQDGKKLKVFEDEAMTKTSNVIYSAKVSKKTVSTSMNFFSMIGEDAKGITTVLNFKLAKK